MFCVIWISGDSVNRVERCDAFSSMDFVPTDVIDLLDRTVARYGELVSLIGAKVGIDDLAAADDSPSRGVLSHLGL